MPFAGGISALMAETGTIRRFGSERKVGRWMTVVFFTQAYNHRHSISPPIGAFTQCHQDAYGVNLVAQVEGRKKWTLFPPEGAAVLNPTRIPYEESTVFSRLNVARMKR